MLPVIVLGDRNHVPGDTIFAEDGSECALPMG